MNLIGEKIRKVRKAAHLTQKELAKLSGIAEITIRKYERDSLNETSTNNSKL